MNRLMLSTMAADRGNTQELDRIFSLWARNALLLCMEADKLGDDRAVHDLDRLAAALKLELCWQEPLPTALSGEQRGLFFSTTQEAMVNAVKHAEAKRLTISFSPTEAGLITTTQSSGRWSTGSPAACPRIPSAWAKPVPGPRSSPSSMRPLPHNPAKKAGLCRVEMV